MKPRHKLLGDRTRIAVADRPAVDLDHRDHLRGRARKEALVGDVDVVLGKRSLADGQPGVRSQAHDHGPRDAGQDTPGVVGEKPVG